MAKKRRERVRRISTREKAQAVNHKIRVENAIEDGCAADGPTRVRVRVLSVGYFNHKRYYEGDVFTIPGPEAYSEKWMEVVPASTPESLTTSHEKLRDDQQQLREQKGAELKGRLEEATATGATPVLTGEDAAVASG